MTIDDAAKLLGITSLPTSLNAIRTAFRRKSRDEHPDVSKHPEAAKRFQALVDARKRLEADPKAVALSGEDLRGQITDDGTPLTSLGKGLGPMTNGRPCGDCNGLGYRSYASAHEICSFCRGNGWVPRGTSRLGCRHCKELGIRLSPTKRHFATCEGCKGTGEIRIFNPVLPKGFLA